MRYVHIVFTPQLAALALQNKRLFYGLLLRGATCFGLSTCQRWSHCVAILIYDASIKTYSPQN